MSLHNTATNVAGVATGTAAATVSWWADFVTNLPSYWQFIVQAGGFVVLVLTGIKLVLDIIHHMRRKRGE